MNRFSRKKRYVIGTGKLAVGGFLALVLILLAWAASRLLVLNAAYKYEDEGENFDPMQQEDFYIYMPAIAKGCHHCFYVDSVNGSDANPGTSEEAPWRTLAPVHARNFVPDSTVHLKRGSSWTGGLVIDNSGVEGHPILFTTYGAGDRPVISNPGNSENWTRGIQIMADWVIVEGLLVRDAHESGVYIRDGADHNIVRDIEATDVGTGITVEGRYNLVTDNYVHDLHMIRNTVGGNDDFGAVGVKLHNSYNEVSYNSMVNCIASSYDYGVDGGGVEWWGDANNNYVHHNWVAWSAGFLEVGGGSATDTTVAYNVSYNNGRFSFIHLSEQFASYVDNFRLENNTIIETVDGNPGWVVLGFKGIPTASTFRVRNNVFYIEEFSYICNEPSFTHDHNLYYLSGGTELGFALGSGEVITDPLFADLTGEDFHLLSDSSAIDAGVDLGYSLDFEDNLVPAGTAPDLGAFEYGSGSVIVPTPTPNPNELVIDNADPGFSTAFTQDEWLVFTNTIGQHYGDTHHYNSQIGTGEDIATWSFTVPRPGQYEVYAWWWEYSWRPTDVPYTVNHAGGSTTIRVDQQTGGGQWNLLGTFDFQSQGSVIVSDDVSSGQDIVADAIRLLYVGGLDQ